MDLRELFLIAVRSAHALAAVALVGGSAFHLFILAPALRLAGPAAESVRARAEAGFKEIVDLTLPVFLVSGGLLTFERLASGAAGTAYVAVLGLKLLLSLLLYRWAFQVRRSGGGPGPASILGGVRDSGDILGDSAQDALRRRPPCMGVT